MTGEKDLSVLLASMSPELMPGEFVFVSLPQSDYGDFKQLEPVVSVAEHEGLTLVIPRVQADAHALAYESSFKCITLKIHSSLDAVGLTAAVGKQLADHHLSVNVVAGFYHDHLFVSSSDANKALDALFELAESQTEG